MVCMRGLWRVESDIIRKEVLYNYVSSSPLKIRAVAASWPGRPARTRYPRRHQLQAKNPKRVGLRSDNAKPLQASKYFLHFSYYVLRTTHCN